MNVVVLTSSRADYGIYLPLLRLLNDDPFFNLKIVAFGTHPSQFYGYTINQIQEDGFEVAYTVESLILGDSPEAISTAIGTTVTKFASLWSQLEGKTDLIVTLGDRYEMFAAITAALPFGFKIAHLHGGETTLGTLDNTFRHAISIMSNYHFVATDEYAKRVAQLINSDENIYNVGALSLDNIESYKLLTKNEFLSKFGIDIDIPTILTTFHPETVNAENNKRFAEVIAESLDELTSEYQVVITMPNADTMGTVIRNEFNTLVQSNDRVIGIENFGKLGYFSCMKYCKFLLGNTSSGIIEAASFGKYVLNLGDRQYKRARSENIIDVSIDKDSIIDSVSQIEDFNYKGGNVYYKKNSAEIITKNLKSLDVQINDANVN